MRFFRHFQGQHQDEEVLQVIHRHWFNIGSHLLIVIVFSIFLVGSFLVLPTLFPGAFTEDFWGLFLFLENTFFIFVWLFGFLVWVDYYFDVWIVTNERIINIEQKGLFVRHISELNLHTIQDVTSEVEGIIPTILNYGDVYVQTAGEQGRFTFRQVPDPYRIKDLVIKLSRNKGVSTTTA